MKFSSKNKEIVAPTEMPTPEQLMRECARNGDEVGLLHYLTKGISPDAANENGYTALHTAKQPEIITLLVEAGASLEARTVNQGVFPLFTPLHCTIEWDSVETARELIRCGADVEAHNAYGETPLRLAVDTSGSYCLCAPKVARLLVESGADVNARDDCGQTILGHASSALRICPAAHISDSLEIIELLRERGAVLD